ncbi:MAG TPA: metal ABC transporter permease [Propioniciclava tarda]|nr:metal ABC transporter permease [Propioniciclava tarda]HQA30889.1 metal ABC transporter permease [Propioniciclava tarda]HQD60977.1 metal ABC transporter permease [Propioniciclava tarda]
MTPLDWLAEPFALGFQQRALIGGVIAAVMSSTVGVWLVLRGMSFFGDAFVHAVLPGIAAAMLFDFSPYLGAAIAAVVMVGGIEFIHRQTALKEDTAIGLLFVGMMALGVAIISKSPSFTGSLTSILFGDTFGVTWAAIQGEAVMAAIVVVGSLVLYRPLLGLSFSATKASTLGLKPRLTHALLLAMIALAVIGSFQAVGTLLVFGLLVGPPATAALLSRTVPRMIATSILLALAAVVVGLTLSYRLGTAGAATIALVAVGTFFVVMHATWLRRILARRRAARAETRAQEVTA